MRESPDQDHRPISALSACERAVQDKQSRFPRARYASVMGVRGHAGRAGVILALIALTGCAIHRFDAGQAETALPLNRAWVDGHIVEYVTTDISDPTMAKALGVNLVPRLSDAIAAQPGHSVLERVYKFPNNEQVSIFQSAPAPAGAENVDDSYSPLWRMVLVRWTKPETVHELKSEEELLAAEDRKEVVLQVTNIVVNCPITRSADGRALRGVH